MKGLEIVKCESLRINMYRITHTGKSVNFPVTTHKEERSVYKNRFVRSYEVKKEDLSVKKTRL